MTKSPDTGEVKTIEYWLAELEDAVWCSRGDNFTQNEAAKERVTVARHELESIMQYYAIEARIDENAQWQEAVANFISSQSVNSSNPVIKAMESLRRDFAKRCTELGQLRTTNQTMKGKM